MLAQQGNITVTEKEANKKGKKKGNVEVVEEKILKLLYIMYLICKEAKENQDKSVYTDLPVTKVQT